MAPLLSLVTGTRNRPDSFHRLLASIIRHTSFDWELVVSDASDEPYEMQLPERVRILPERPRLGCTAGYNRAFRECRGEFVLWLNDDVEVTSGYDTESIVFMLEHPEIGLGALYYSEDGGPFHVNSAWGATYANFGILRRELGERVGFFDEDLVMYGCDNSLTFRVLLSGAGVAGIPEARVIHHSEKDRHRLENQTGRSADNDTLARKYMPLRREWLETFNRLRIADAAAWPHGRNPEQRGSL